MYYKGVDVSKYDGVVDWKTVSKKGYGGFAILRATIGTKTDSLFITNYNNYLYLNKPIGYYAAVHATKMSTIRKEAKFFLEQIKILKRPFCVFVDMECKEQKALTKRAVTDLLNEWCEIVRKEGYPCGVYTNPSWYKYEMYPDEIKCDMWWIAHYAKSSKLFREKGMIWQYTSDGKIGDIKHTFDLNKGKAELMTWFVRTSENR